MQTKWGFAKVFGTGLRAFFKRILPAFPAQAPVAAACNKPQAKSTTVVDDNETPVATQPIKAKRFRRTTAELKLGLTIEQAMAARANLPQKQKKDRKPRAVKDSKPVENKAPKRFKRTKQEIELGLSIEQAAAIRGVELPGRPKKIYVERKVDVQPLAGGDLIDTLSPRIQVRARTMSNMRARGHKGEITTEMLDQAAAAVAAGKVTKCPPYTDSDGYNHFTGQEVK